MLRKSAQSNPKNPPSTMANSISDSCFQSDALSQNHKSTSFLKVPGLFVGFNPGSSEFDSVRSPTSTLDFRIFSSFGNPFRLTRLSQNEGYSKRWDSDKVGLSIVDSLDDETKESGRITRSCHDGKNVVFGQRMSVRSPNISSRVDFVEMPKSLPANLPVFPNAKQVGGQKGCGDSDVVFEIGRGGDGPELYENFHACSLDSGRYGSHLTNFGSKLSLGSGNSVINKPIPLESGNLSRGKVNSIPPPTHVGTSFIRSFSTSEIELSEDYTCVRTHGPNPKVTHIFGDCILECHEDEVSTKSGDVDSVHEEENGLVYVNILDSYPSNDFLKFCYSCKKKLDGEDIYMYRGEKAFCSYSCRLQEIEIDEEIEKMTAKMSSPEILDKPSSSKGSLFIAT